MVMVRTLGIPLAMVIAATFFWDEETCWGLYLIGALVMMIATIIYASDRADKGKPRESGDSIFYCLAVILWPISVALIIDTVIYKWKEKKKLSVHDRPR
ncbi:MAG: hypothetical protein J6334_01425 [Kiritimatiellae bacterium]|nr:hypothetical protein [Kiritimatiellia bacterium]